MNPWNGASSSILPGSEEGIGGRHGFPGTLAGADVYNEWIETLLTSMLDDTGLHLADEQAMARPKTVSLLSAHQQPSLRRGGVAHRAGRRPGVWSAFAAVFPRRDGPPLSIDMSLSEVARGKLMVAADAGKP